MKPGAGFVAVVSCVLLVATCTTPATTRTEGPHEAGPRFARGGPDAEEYGASLGYPKGERGTFLRVPSLVGSLSHLDELFKGRAIAKAAAPSRLARAASEPAIPWEFQPPGHGEHRGPEANGGRSWAPRIYRSVGGRGARARGSR